MGTETYIPWEEWGRDPIVTETQAFNLSTCVQGVHVTEAEMRRVPGDNVDMRLRAFDFSKWGCSTLCDEGGEAVRTARYKYGRELLLEESGNVSRLGFGSLDNGVFYSLVSRLCHLKTGVG